MSVSIAGILLSDPIQIGAIVWLKSGGPPMMVYHLESDRVSVEWFVCGEIRRDVFYRVCLQLEEPAHG